MEVECISHQKYKEQSNKEEHDVEIDEVVYTDCASERSSHDDQKCKSEMSVTNVCHDCDINTLISVTIKKENNKRYTPSRLTPRGLKYKDDSQGLDEVCCLKEGYKLGKKIGEGAYSKVKAAEILPEKTLSDSKIGRLVKKNGHRLVAVKILNKDKAPSDYTTKFIGREIQALHRIRGHPNVVEIYDVFETSEYLFIITELCQKGDLCQYINAHTEAGHCGLTESKARDFFVQICHGMHYCHQRGVVHRDFKCENVLICDDENTVKISDFGFACTVPNKRLMLSTPCGSYSYAAPEVLFGKSYDPFLADVWSLGVVLFCMLNGTTPYGHVQLSMVEDYMKTQRLQFQKISRESKLLIKQLLKYDPRKRPRFLEILKSPWVNKQKVNIVERLYTPMVPDRSHIAEMVNKFKVPTAPSQSTEHRLCINFSRISFGNGSESILLKSRQPHRERDRFFHIRPVLKRTRMSVVEFKEHMGLNINQSQPIAQILKNIIAGAKTRGGRGDESQEQKIVPALPGNISTWQCESDQNMIEYLAEMWADIDRDQGTTMTGSTEGIKPKTAPPNCNTEKLPSDVDDYEVPKPQEAGEYDQEVFDQENEPDEEKEQGTEEAEATRECHPPPGANCCCCQHTGGDGEDAGTELSFCSCSNPETMMTGSTYTVHVPQPQNDVPESPSPPPNAKWTDCGDTNKQIIAEHKQVDDKVCGSTSKPNWAEMANLYKPNTTLTVAERARAVNDKAERVLARARVHNGTAPYDSNLYRPVESPALNHTDSRRCKQLIESITAARAAKALKKAEQNAGKKKFKKSKYNLEKRGNCLTKAKSPLKVAVVKNLTMQEGGSGRRQALALVSPHRVPLNRDGNMVFLRPPQTAPEIGRHYVTELHEVSTTAAMMNEVVSIYQRTNKSEKQRGKENIKSEVGKNVNNQTEPVVEDPAVNIDQEELKTSLEEPKFVEGNMDMEKDPNSGNKIDEENKKDENIEEDNSVAAVHVVAEVDQIDDENVDTVTQKLKKVESLGTEIVENEVCESVVKNNVTDADIVNISEEDKETPRPACENPSQTDLIPALQTELEGVNSEAKEKALEIYKEEEQQPKEEFDEERPGSGELDKQMSSLSVDSVDEELLKVANMMATEEPVSPLYTPLEITPMPQEVQHLVTPVRMESKSVSPMVRERLYFLKPRRTESEKSPIPSNHSDPLYQRHARATPVKDKYLTDEINAEIKKSKKLVSKKGTKSSFANETGRHSMTSTFLKKSPRRGRPRPSAISTDVRRLVDNMDRDNKSLPLLQVHKSYVTRPLTFQTQPQRRGKSKDGEGKQKKQKGARHRTRSPFPNPMSNPNLWQSNPENLQHIDEAQSTPCCPVLPQKVHYTRELSRRHFRNHSVTPGCEVNKDTCTTYNYTEIQPSELPEKITNLFPPVKNLSFDEQNKSPVVITGIRQQH